MGEKPALHAEKQLLAFVAEGSDLCFAYVHTIMNGYDSPEKLFYVRAKIRHNKGTSRCGGSIITSEHVLSAAQCFKQGMF